jgi:glycosyltransferase involved in cell wall biosynthesis
MLTASIGIPCYNSECSVGKAVESALQQTVPIEVIVVDDGSSDNSVAILRRFGDRIRLIEANHRGGNHARNLALEAATGEWIQFLDADDYLLEDKIALQLEEGGDTSAIDVLYSPVFVEQDRNGNGPALEIGSIDTELDLYAQWIAWQLPQTGGALWRRESLLALGSWNETMPCCQEHELYLRALMKGLRFRMTPTARAVYRIWSEDTVCRRDPAQLYKVRTALIDLMCDWLKETGRWNNQHTRIAGRICFEMARGMAKSDLERAESYHDERRKRGLIHLAGPAAPEHYRIAYRALGFRRAEKLAKMRRRYSQERKRDL